jgi:NAD(P)H-hydrate epimerase
MSGIRTELPVPLYRAVDVRELDRRAIEGFGIAGAELMERAGAAAFEILGRTWPAARRLLVLCGTGNNGGDGFVIARLAHTAGREVRVAILGDAAKVRGDAAAKLGALSSAGVTPLTWRDAEIGACDLIVDALLGTGLDRDLGGEHREAVDAINASAAPVLSVDIPSGLNADTGQPMSAAVNADVTVTFVGMKQGLLTGAAAAYCGRLYFSDLGIPDSVSRDVAPSAYRDTRTALSHFLPQRRRDAHKGDYGHALVIGGEHGYVGAARMAAEASARVGAGLTSIATRPEHAAVMNLTRPELMCHGVTGGADLLSLIKLATVIAIGPGLGRSDWAAGLLSAVLDARVPLVVDADALNLLAQDPVRRENWVLTPHPGEAARLLGCTTQAVQADRYAAVRALESRYGGVCVLKGAGTLVADSVATYVCPAGNPGMASGGMGDVLTGVIAGLLAQGLDLGMAARLGVCVHAEAADQAAAQGERGLLAGDLMPWLRHLVN